MFKRIMPHWFKAYASHSELKMSRLYALPFKTLTKRHLLFQHNTKLLWKIQLLSLWQCPVKRVHKRSKWMHHHPLSHCNPSTYSSARSKWEIVEVISTIVPFGVQEPFWIKLQWVFPNGRVPVYCPHVEENPGSFRDGVASHSAGFTWAVRD